MKKSKTPSASFFFILCKKTTFLNKFNILSKQTDYKIIYFFKNMRNHKNLFNQKWYNSGSQPSDSWIIKKRMSDKHNKKNESTNNKKNYKAHCYYTLTIHSNKSPLNKSKYATKLNLFNYIEHTSKMWSNI
jgi:hypothetical protein